MENILIIGYGNMGQAIGRALGGRGGFKVFAYDKNRQKIKGVKPASLDDLPKYQVIIIAVKPQDVPVLSEQLRGNIPARAILVSIAAGVTLKNLARLFGHNKILRLMPNLGVTVGQGIAAWKTAGLSSADKKMARRMLNVFTENFEVADERLIDAVTAVSGSGPAYFFFFADGLLSAAKKLGLSLAQSRLLVEKTMSAAARLQIGANYQELIKRVRSKKGTTDAALKVFAKRSLSKIIDEAVRAAFKRANELSNA